LRTAVDPRFTARRIEVRESWARRRLRWIVIALGIVLVGAVGYALFQSPWLAIRTISVEGATRAAVHETLDAAAVHAGMPTVAVRPRLIEESLRRDPWVADARVEVAWPGSIDITVIERSPAAWLRTTTGWALVAYDGTLVARGEPAVDEPVLLTDVGPLVVGETISNPDIVGAATLLGLLPPVLAVGATAEVFPAGIEATIGGFRVLVGNGRDIPEKVATVIAILTSDPPQEGAVINVISPTRPGINNPQPLVEGESEEVSPSEISG